MEEQLGVFRRRGARAVIVRRELVMPTATKQVHVVFCFILTADTSTDPHEQCMHGKYVVPLSGDASNLAQ